MIPLARLKAIVEVDDASAMQQLQGFGSRAQQRLSQGLSGMGRSAGASLAGAMAGGFAGAFTVAGATQVLRSIGGVIGQGAELYQQNERLKMQLQSMSAMELVGAGQVDTFSEGLALAGERAEELHGWVRKLSIQSPYSASDISPLLRLGMVYGFNSDQAMRLTEATMDYGAAVGLTGPDMERVVRALGQMQTRGKVAGSEMLQLSEAGVPALQILADAAGVTTAQMMEMIEKGIVQSGPAIEAITRSFEGYSGAADASAETLGGMLSALKDIKDFALVDFLTPAFESAKPALQDLIDLLSSEGFQGGLATAGEAFGELLKGPAEGAVEWLPKLMQLFDSDKAPKWEENLAPPFESLSNWDQFASAFQQRTDLVDGILDGLVAAVTDKTDALAGLARVGEFVEELPKVMLPSTEPENWAQFEAEWKAVFSGTWDWTKGKVKEPLKPTLDTTGVTVAFDEAWGSVQATVNGEALVPSADSSALLDAVIAAHGEAQTYLDREPLNGFVTLSTSIDPQSRSSGSRRSGRNGFGLRSNAPPVGDNGFIQYAQGTSSALEGWAWVGEEGPELMYVPGGATVVDAKRSQGLWRALGGLPGFAEGTGPQPWIPGNSSSFGDPSALVAGLQIAAAEETASAAKELRDAAADFASMLSGVPGLFESSPVTKEQMEMAELGVPQNFADDYLRRLTDEVMNGVDWEGVDIQDAAARAGIDASLPAEAILKMFAQSWNDSSLFANPANLDLINTDAVAQAMQKQKDSEAGEANIMALFGIGDEALVESVAGLGLNMQSSLTTWLNENGMPEAGAAAAGALSAGVISNSGALGAGVSTGLDTWAGSAEARAALLDMGQRIGDMISSGVRVTPNVESPAGDQTGSGAPPAANAGSSTNGTGQAAAQTVNIYATVSAPHDIPLLAQQVAREMRKKKKKERA